MALQPRGEKLSKTTKNGKMYQNPETSKKCELNGTIFPKKTRCATMRQKM
jgi:hypothetical protein